MTRRLATSARPVVQFALSGLAAVLLLGVGGTVVLRHLGRAEAIRDARRLTRLAGDGIVEPALTDGVVNGQPQALRRVDTIVRRRVVRGDIVRVKLWDASGKIVYSDEHRLIGLHYPLGDDERHTLSTGAVDAELSDLGRPENRFERRYGKLLEVYARVRGPHGRPLLFEQYQRFSSIAASSRRIWRTFLPVLVGTLLLLWVAQGPLAWSMVRRIRAAERQRVAALMRAVDASQAERRAIARGLHDGPVQELAGVSFSLAASADRSRDEDAIATLRAGAAATRRAVRALRSLLIEIYPPSLERAGLPAALRDVVASAAHRGIDVNLEIDEAFKASPATERAIFRAAQESVRNVIAHADASHLDVSIDRFAERVVLEVRDDGRGFDADGAVGGEGHFGLSLLADLAEEAGGTLAITSGDGGGTTVCLEVQA